MIDNVPDAIGVWTPTPKSAKPNERLRQAYTYLDMLMKFGRPDEICMEVIRVNTSHDTTRSLSRFEAAAIIAAGRAGITTIHEHAVSEARKAYFGEGGISKHEAHDVVRKLYPHLDWLPKYKANGKDDGPGLDQSDALVAALARDKLAERPNGRAAKRSRR